MKSLILLFLYSTFILAIPEKQLSLKFESHLLPFWKKSFLAKTAPLSSNSKHFVGYYTNSISEFKKVFVFIPGRTEPVQQYLEYYYDIWQEDTKFIMIDLPGQGSSSRFLKDKMKGHLPSNQVFFTFIQQVLEKEQVTNRDIILHGNSTGALAALLFYQKDSSKIESLILSAPFIGLRTSMFSSLILKTYIPLALSLGHSTSYFPTNPGKYKPHLKFAHNPFTYSQERFKVMRSYLNKMPHLLIGGPTIAWLDHIFSLQKSISKVNFINKAPIKIFLGKQDPVISNKDAIRFCDSIKKCSYQTFDPAKHEIFNESDEVRSKVVQEVKSQLTIF